MNTPDADLWLPDITHAQACIWEHVYTCTSMHIRTCTHMQPPHFQKMRVLIHVKSENIKVPEIKIMYFGGTSPWKCYLDDSWNVPKSSHSARKPKQVAIIKL